MAREDQWLDEEAGPVVRPYALTRGRTRPTGEVLDLIALVTAVRGVEVDPMGLDPEHLALLRMCRLPASVADLASDLDLRSEEHTSELQSHVNLVCRLLLEKKKKNSITLSLFKEKTKKIPT